MTTPTAAGLRRLAFRSRRLAARSRRLSVRLRRLASPHLPAAASPRRRAAALLLRLASVGLLSWIGYIHLHLWLEGYRQIPTDGPLFLLDAITGLALAATLLAWPRPLAGLLAAGYTTGTLGALLTSLTVGLFGFRESVSASFVTQSIVVEAITVAVLLAWTLLVTAAPRVIPRQDSAAREAVPSR